MKKCALSDNKVFKNLFLKLKNIPEDNIFKVKLLVVFKNKLQKCKNRLIVLFSVFQYVESINLNICKISFKIMKIKLKGDLQVPTIGTSKVIAYSLILWKI